MKPTRTLPPCDIAALMRIEAYAPHMLTAHDRHCLRLHKAAPAVSRATILAPLVCALALILLAVLGAAK